MRRTRDSSATPWRTVAQGLTTLAATMTMMLNSDCARRDVPAPAPSHLEAQSLRYLALGDSYTIGESVGVSERWPAQLVALLRAHGVAIGEPEIIARTGWTTDELDAAITAAAPQGPFDLVTLMIGVNNQYRGRDREEFRRQFAALILRAVGLAGGVRERVIVLSIPDWGVTPFAAGRDRAAIAAEIDRFNAVCTDEAQRAHVRYVDVTAISRAATHDSSLVAADGLHPSRALHARWADAVLTAATQALRTR